MIILETFIKLLLPIKRYGLFIVEIFSWVVVLSFLTPFFLVLFQVVFSKIQVSFGDLVLLITAAFILAYTYEAKKMRLQIIFHQKMSYATDLRFRMAEFYQFVEGSDMFFGEFATKEEANNSVSSVSFLSAITMAEIGRCGRFFKKNIADEFLKAQYFIKTEEGKRAFLRTLKLQNGVIRVKVLTTNGTKFIYTFKTIHENWRKALKTDLRSSPALSDDFILVKKELLDLS